MKRGVLATGVVLLLASCSSSADGGEVLNSLTGEVACSEPAEDRSDPDEDPLWSCASSAGHLIAASNSSDPTFSVAVFLDEPAWDTEVYVLHEEQGWHVIAPTRQAGEQVADQTGAVVADQSWFDGQMAEDH